MKNIAPFSLHIPIVFFCVFSGICFSDCLYAQRPGDVRGVGVYLSEWEIDVAFEDETGKLKHEKARINLRNPQKQDEFGYGVAIAYSSTTGTRKNANGEHYPYTEVSIDENWKAKSDSGKVVSVKECQKFWDIAYKGYERVSDVDLSQNCHGYSFGVGGHPVNATRLLALGPYAYDSGKSPLFENTRRFLSVTIAADILNIAIDPGGTITPTLAGVNHSIKVKSTACSVNGHKRLALTESTEQFRESGTYKQTSTCPKSISLTKAPIIQAHSLSFGLFKPFQNAGGARR